MLSTSQNKEKLLLVILFMGGLKHCYSKMDPENLSVDLRYDIVVSSINLLVISSKRGSPYKSTSVLMLSDNKSKFSKTLFTLFIRLIRICEK